MRAGIQGACMMSVNGYMFNDRWLLGRRTFHHPAFIRSDSDDGTGSHGRNRRDGFVHLSVCNSVSKHLLPWCTPSLFPSLGMHIHRTIISYLQCSHAPYQHTPNPVRSGLGSAPDWCPGASATRQKTGRSLSAGLFGGGLRLAL